MIPLETAAKPLLHKREIAALRMGISLRMLDELCLTGQIASIKIGKRRLISESAIQKYIRKHERAAKYAR